MYLNRRKFLTRLGGVGLGTAAFFDTLAGQTLQSLIQESASKPPGEMSTDEDFWYWVKQAYSVSPGMLNLNNGGVSPQPRVVQEAVERYGRLSNEAPSYYMWRVLDQGREPLRSKLAELAGCDAEELAINRNSSEALETIIFGLRLQAGDEVVLCHYDYPNMMNAWKQRAHREGIKLRWVDLEFPMEDEETIAQRYIDAFTPATKVVHLTHMINWCGQILPVKRIASEAHRRGIEVIVDAAHSFAHVPFAISDLECDYLGTSLHKWLSAPFGTGLLYVRKDKIAQLYPLFAGEEPESDNIRKFENLGTRSFPIEQAIGQAIDFHYLIGTERKHERLQWLKNYWVEVAQARFPNMRLYTSLKPEFACALALAGWEGHDSEELGRKLEQKHKIHVVPIKWRDLDGLRITPNVYTTRRDLDRLLTALEDLVGE